MATMNDILKAVQKHEQAIASQAIDNLVKRIHEVLEEQDSDLLESLEQYLSDIVKSVKTTMEEESKAAAKKKGGKKEKDPNAPKRALSKFNIFIRNHMAMLAEKHPEVLPKDRMKKATEAWNELSAEEKAAIAMGAPEAAPRPAILPDSDNEATTSAVNTKKKGKK
jgi:hypothetical protein